MLNSEAPPIVFVDNEPDLSGFSDSTNIPIKTMVKERRSGVDWLIMLAVALFVTVYMFPIMKLEPAAHSCLAVVLLVSFLWATEGIPSYATSYLVPFLGVWLKLGVDKSTGQRIGSDELAAHFSYRLMDPVILVFLGAMVISECFTKLHITDRISQMAFRRMSKKPHFILLTLMFLNMFIAAFFSNIASSTLILNFTMPMIRNLDPDDPFIKAVLFGIAWSGNLGGMCTPIASPINVLALNYIHKNSSNRITFMEWMMAGFPVCIVTVSLFWLYLIYRYKPHRSSITISEKSTEFEGWALKHNFAVLISALTIILWSLEDTFPSWLGHVGITSLIPVILFYGSGILSTKDFHNIKWPTLVMMGGGLVLGELMKLSSLLDLISDATKVSDGLSLWVLTLVSLSVIGFGASMINSTSAAAVVYPVIYAMGASTNHPSLMVILSALMISGAQLFHISSFPNALVASVNKHTLGSPDNITESTFLKSSEFFLIGWPTIIISILLNCSLGYGLVLLLKL